MATRGPKNVWQPNEEDRKRIVQQIAQNPDPHLVAIMNGIDTRTLKKHCSAEIEEGYALNRGLIRSEGMKVLAQNDNYSAKQRAVEYQNAVLHGIRADAPPMDEEHHDQDDRDAALEALDAKLAPYLKINDERKAEREAVASPAALSPPPEAEVVEHEDEPESPGQDETTEGNDPEAERLLREVQDMLK